MKKTANTLIVVGAVLTIGDRLSGGRLFGAGGVLAGINAALPQFSIAGIQTDLGVWLLIVGVVMRLV